MLAGLLAAQPVPAGAQAGLDPIQDPATIRWWHGAIALGGLSALMLLDEPGQRFVQERRSGSGDDIARAVRRFGQPEVYATVTAGMVVGGLIGGNDELTRAGGRLAATLALAGAASSLTKFAFGRLRPSESLDAGVFDPFSGEDALPSGHATIAFALATALADDIGNPWAAAGLYTLATGVAWSRVNDNRHWLSDVAAGAMLGMTSAKLMNGRWRLFRLRPPRVLLGPRHAVVAWHIVF